MDPSGAKLLGFPQHRFHAPGVLTVGSIAKYAGPMGYCRERGEEACGVADDIIDSDSNRRKLRIADDYEELATRREAAAKKAVKPRFVMVSGTRRGETVPLAGGREPAFLH